MHILFATMHITDKSYLHYKNMGIA